jgi:N-acetylglucosamine kinase-like BadF-type ATPase
MSYKRFAQKNLINNLQGLKEIASYVDDILNQAYEYNDENMIRVMGSMSDKIKKYGKDMYDNVTNIK